MRDVHDMAYLSTRIAFYPSSHMCTIPCKSRNKNKHDVYSPKSISPFIANVKAMTLQRRTPKNIPILLHEHPPLRLLLRPDIVPRRIWRSIIPTVATIVSISVITRRITRVAIPSITGRVGWTTVAIPIRPRCVVSTEIDTRWSC